MKYKNRVYCELNESKDSDDERRTCLTRRCLAFMCICAIILIVFGTVLALILAFIVFKDKDPVIEGAVTETTKTSILPVPSIVTTRETSSTTTATITRTSTNSTIGTTATSTVTSTTPSTTTTTIPVTTTTFTSTTTPTTTSSFTTTMTTTAVDIPQSSIALETTAVESTTSTTTADISQSSTALETTTVESTTSTTTADISQSSMALETTIVEMTTTETTTADISQSSMRPDTTIVEGTASTTASMMATTLVTDILQTSIGLDTIPTTSIVSVETSTVTDILESSIEPDTVFTTVIEPMTTTTSTTTSTTTTSTTTRACIPACTATQSCVNGACVGSGNLAISLTWNVAGDGDIVVTTPNNKHIFHGNKGPGAPTDGGQLDRDDTSGTGPENVFWPTNVTPPTGNYHVCFQQYSLSATILRPITATIEVRKPFFATQIYQKTFTSEGGFKPNTCSPVLSTFIVTVAYP